MRVAFNDEIMASLFPDAWKKSPYLVDAPTEAMTSEPVNNRPSEEGTERPRADKGVQLKKTPLSVPIKEKVSDLKEPEASTPELFSLQEENPDKSTKKPSKPFDFEAHIKDYEERRNKGNQEMQGILSDLTDERARDYVRLYFASALVQWDIKKLKMYIRQNLKTWKEHQSKYGEGSIANYSESIKTGELILRTLEEGKL